MFSNTTFWILCLLMVIVAIIPFVGYFIAKKTISIQKREIFIGIGVFITFVFIFERLLMFFCLSGTNRCFPTSISLIHFFIFQMILLAFFEETGRYLGLRYMAKNSGKEKKRAVSYGIGHGGVAIWLSGVLVIAELISIIWFNRHQPDVMTQQFPHINNSNVALSSVVYLLSFIALFVMQIGLSLIVWKGICKKWFWILPLAIMLNIIMHLPQAIFRVFPGHTLECGLMFLLIIFIGLKCIKQAFNRGKKSV